jgi:predicted GIY-YIG superfamily endonuclease
LSAWFYILRLHSDGLYCGSTKDRSRRYKEHFSGSGCRTTKIDPPVAVVYEEEYQTYSEALEREQQIKRWSRAKKEALIKTDLAELKKLAKRKVIRNKTDSST